MSKHQTHKEIRLVYLAWKLGAPIEYAYKSEFMPAERFYGQRGIDWADHGRIKDNDESEYILHSLFMKIIPLSKSELLYRIKGTR